MQSMMRPSLTLFRIGSACALPWWFAAGAVFLLEMYVHDRVGRLQARYQRRV